MGELEQAVLGEFGMYFGIFSREFRGEIKQMNAISALAEHDVLSSSCAIGACRIRKV